MDSNFKEALKHVLVHEGGYVDHPKDPGGATNKGVTIGTYRRYINKNGTKQDLRNITDAQIEKVYYKHYWLAVAADKLPSGVDYAVFDFAVNSGPSRAAKFLQKIVGVAQDGKIGPLTVKAVNAGNAKWIIDQLCGKRLAWLKTLKTWPTFGRGWTVRVSGVETDALEMAHVDRIDQAISDAFAEDNLGITDAIAEDAEALAQKPQERVKPIPAPEPAPNPPSAPRGNSGRNTLIGGVIAVVLMALAGWWEAFLELVKWPWW